MWKYNLSSNCVEEYLDEGCYSMKNKLDKIPVSGKVEWIDGQEVVEMWHFVITNGTAYQIKQDNPQDEYEIVSIGEERIKLTIPQPKEHKSDIEQEAEKIDAFLNDIVEVNFKGLFEDFVDDNDIALFYKENIKQACIEYHEWMKTQLEAKK